MMISNMDIKVTFIGVLGELIHKEAVIFNLSEGATYSDLLCEIWHRFGHSIPAALWDHQFHGFKAPIMAMTHGRYLESRAAALKEGEEIKFLTLVAGG